MGQFRGFQIASGAIASRHLENNIAIRGTFSVASGTALSGSLTVSSGATLSGTLSVRSGADFLANVHIASGLYVGQEASITGNALIGGTLIASGNAQMKAALQVGGALTVTGASILESLLDVAGAAQFASSVVVTGASALKSTLDVVGLAQFANNVQITGASILQSTLDVAGAAQLASSVSVTGASMLKSTLDVAGLAQFANNVQITGASILKSTLDVAGLAQFANNVQITGASVLESTLDVAGAAQFASSVVVTGASALKSTLNVGGLAQFAGAVQVTGAITMESTMLQKGAATFQSTVTLAQDPASALQAATKQYVDHVAQGLTVKEMVWAASKVALPANNASESASNNSHGIKHTKLTAENNGALVLDGYSVDNGDRVLIKDEALAKFNGIYIVIDKGSVSSAWVLERDEDANIVGELPRGTYCFVKNGTDQSNTSWVLNSSISALAIADAGDDLNFVQFSGAGTLQAGQNIYVLGNTVALGFDGNSSLKSSVTMVSGANLTIDEGGDLILKSNVQKGHGSMVVESGASISMQAGASFSVDADASFSFAGDTALGSDLAKLVNDSVISGADALHSHALGSLGIKEPKAKAVIADDSNDEVVLASGYYYNQANFAVPSAGAASDSDLEVYLNGQLIEEGNSGAEMPQFTFTRESRVVKVYGSIVGDHIYIRYFAKSTNI